MLNQTVTFDPTRQLDVMVAGDAGDMEVQITGFETSVAITLAVFGFGLVLATFFQIRWGLRPLDRARRSLADLRSGKQTRVEENLPAEIEPLVKELNALLDSNQEIIDRARTQVGNLAHALKTPLSVVINEARATPGPFAAKIAEQGEMMRRQVNHYLDRARIAAQVNVIGAITEVQPAVTRLVRGDEPHPRRARSRHYLRRAGQRALWWRAAGPRGKSSATSSTTPASGRRRGWR
ncbi:MAG: hypothetical protein WDM84_07615 [Bauldia sp.]